MAPFPSIVFKTSRWKASGVIAVGLALATAYTFIPENHSARGGSAAAGFWAFVGLMTVILIVRPQRITLDQNGFVLGGGLAIKQRCFRWHDVEPLFPYRLPFGANCVAFKYRPGRKPMPLSLRSERETDADGFIAFLMPGSSAALAWQMNQYRAAALGETEATNT